MSFYDCNLAVNFYTPIGWQILLNKYKDEVSKWFFLEVSEIRIETHFIPPLKLSLKAFEPFCIVFK